MRSSNGLDDNNEQSDGNMKLIYRTSDLQSSLARTIDSERQCNDSGRNPRVSMAFSAQALLSLPFLQSKQYISAALYVSLVWILCLPR